MSIFKSLIKNELKKSLKKSAPKTSKVIFYKPLTVDKVKRKVARSIVKSIFNPKK